ncbi:hypothetical protein KBC89_03140 [Candidatus Woesebacteria bacterium]|nr:hypothetical protein [Candidatus Woesebacteria bacterium]
MKRVSPDCGHSQGKMVVDFQNQLRVLLKHPSTWGCPSPTGNRESEAAEGAEVGAA